MKNTQRAFSLIELLVVISIIALLLALLLPSLRQAKLTAQTVQCLSNKRQMTVGFTAYAMDHDNVLMPLSSYTDFSNHPVWYQSLAQYALNSDQEVGTTILRCPTYEPIDATANDRSYAINYPGVFAHNDPPAGFENSTLYQGSAKLDAVPGNVYLTADFKTTGSYATTPGAAWVSFIYNPNYPGGQWALDTDTDGDNIDDSVAAQIGDLGKHNGVDPRHPNRTANFCFADGSAKSVTIADWATNENNLWGDGDKAYK